MQQVHLLGGQAVVDAAARVGAEVDRHARLPGGAHDLGESGLQAPHVRGVGGELGVGSGGDVVEGLDVDHGRHERGALGGHPVEQLDRQPRAVLDRVGPGLDDAGDGLLGEGVDGDLGALGLGGVDSGGQDLGLEAGGEVALGAVDPVADELDPAVAELRLPGQRAHDLVRFAFEADAPQVALGGGDVVPGADEARHAVLADELGVGERRSGVADGQDARVAVGVGERAGLVEALDRRGPAPDADVAVGVDQARQGVAAGGDGLGARHRLEGDPVAVDVEVADGVVGQPDHPHVKRASSAPGRTAVGHVASRSTSVCYFFFCCFRNSLMSMSGTSPWFNLERSGISPGIPAGSCGAPAGRPPPRRTTFFLPFLPLRLP